MYAALRDADPVHHATAGDHWVLSRFADVFAAARDTGTFSSAGGLTIAYGDMGAAGLDEVRPMVMLDPPEHTAFRRLVARSFTPRRVAGLEPEIRTTRSATWSPPPRATTGRATSRWRASSASRSRWWPGATTPRPGCWAGRRSC
jgi:cytochrome P450